MALKQEDVDALVEQLFKDLGVEPKEVIRALKGLLEEMGAGPEDAPKAFEALVEAGELENLMRKMGLPRPNFSAIAGKK